MDVSLHRIWARLLLLSLLCATGLCQKNKSKFSSWHPLPLRNLLESVLPFLVPMNAGAHHTQVALLSPTNLLVQTLLPVTELGTELRAMPGVPSPRFLC